MSSSDSIDSIFNNFQFHHPESESQLLSITYKLIDFGLTKRYDHIKDRREQCENVFRQGTPDYLSPEKATPETPYSPFLADSYAMGATLMLALIGYNELDQMFENALQDEHYLTQEEAANLYVGSLEPKKAGPIHEAMLKLLLPDQERIQIDQMLAMMKVN